jgi:hypothetical protein
MPFIVVSKILLYTVAAGVVLVTGASSGHITEVSASPQTTSVALPQKPHKTATPTPTPTAVATEAPAFADPEDASGPVTDIIADTPTRENYTPPAVAGFGYVRPNMSNISYADIPSWISYDVVNDREQSGETEETWNTWLYNFYNEKFGQTWQYQPIEVHAHWWGDPANVPSHNEIVNYINNKDALTVNFVVSANRITNMMPLTWMATTTGYRNPYAWKMEIDPALSEDIYKTVAALMYIVETKNGALRNEPIRLHKEFYPTGCSEIDTAHLRDWVNKFASGEYDITTGLAIVPAPDPAPPAPAEPTPSSSATATADPIASASPTP